jgi:hypothetical protein
MAINLWGVSPLYENESLKEGSIPTVTPIGKILDEGNCGRVIDRGKEACECAVKLTTGLHGVMSGQPHRRQPHSRQSCEATDRNLIQGRWGEVSEPTITKPFSFVRIGKSRACAVKVMRLIQGDLPHVPVSRACPKGGATGVTRLVLTEVSRSRSTVFLHCQWGREGPNVTLQGTNQP